MTATFGAGATTTQPYEKSLAYYIQTGFRLASGDPFPPGVGPALAELSCVEASILIIDDLLDHSALRDGAPALHQQIGHEGAVVEAFALHARAIDAISIISGLLGVSVPEQLRLHELINHFIVEMYTGQALDLQARQDQGYEDVYLKRYLRIISSITGAHVRVGLAIGQTLAGHQPDVDIAIAGEAIGMVRQIRDDFDDYFSDHHEAFGDFKLGLNRLPELLFKRDGGSRSLVLDALRSGRLPDARAMVLTDSVRNGLDDLCRAQIATAGPAARLLDELLVDTSVFLTRP